MENNFPVDLARHVRQYWGDRQPHLPSPKVLRRLLELAYLASLATEEGRRICFNLCCLPDQFTGEESMSNVPGEWWPFTEPRQLTVREISKLALATSADTDGLWVSWSPDGNLWIKGVLNRQADWPRWMRLLGEGMSGLPPGLNLRITAPGCIAAYQGDWLIVELRSGNIESHYGTSLMPVEGLLPAVIQGLASLSLCVGRPKPIEAWTCNDREISLWFETIFFIVDAIQALQHGGTLLILPDDQLDQTLQSIRLKYAFGSRSQQLRQSFIDVIELDHHLAEAAESYLAARQSREGRNDGYEAQKQLLRKLTKETHEARLRHLRNVRFAGGLAGVDGAVVLTHTFQMLGFGGEILCEMPDHCQVEEYHHHSSSRGTWCDIEQFGMRHRSALKLCASIPGATAFVLSQDGGVALVWASEEKVMIRKQFIPDIDAITTRVRMCIDDHGEQLHLTL
jgi:hypothetical protein